MLQMGLAQTGSSSVRGMEGMNDQENKREDEGGRSNIAYLHHVYKVKKKLLSILLPISGKFRVAPPNEGFEHAWCNANLVSLEADNQKLLVKQEIKPNRLCWSTRMSQTKNSIFYFAWLKRCIQGS